MVWIILRWCLKYTTGGRYFIIHTGSFVLIARYRSLAFHIVKMKFTWPQFMADIFRQAALLPLGKGVGVVLLLVCVQSLVLTQPCYWNISEVKVFRYSFYFFKKSCSTYWLRIKQFSWECCISVIGTFWFVYPFTFRHLQTPSWNAWI
jgi:hypothetical protein